MKILLGLAAAATLIASQALAADMPLKAPLAPVSPGWSGFYVGGHLGVVDSHASGTSDFLDPLATPPDSVANPQHNSLSQTSAIGGFQAGYNWQFDRMYVLGVEGDFSFLHPSYSFCRQTNTNSTACVNTGDGFETIGSSTHWLSTVRGRLGVTVENFLFYGTGGVAFGRVETDLALTCPTGCGSSIVPVFASSTTTSTQVGWAAGLGGEMMIYRNWSARLEWLHIDLGDINSSLTTAGTTPVGRLRVPSTQTATWSRDERYDVIRFGVDFHFQ